MVAAGPDRAIWLAFQHLPSQTIPHQSSIWTPRTGDAGACQASVRAEVPAALIYWYPVVLGAGGRLRSRGASRPRSAAVGSPVLVLFYGPSITDLKIVSAPAN